MQPAEKCRTLRRQVRYPASIELDGGSEPIRCALCDASQELAQIEVEDVSSVPDEFTLVLGYDGTARRRCKVIWRSETQLGVEFRKLPKTGRPQRPTAAPRPTPPETPDGFDIDSLSSR